MLSPWQPLLKGQVLLSWQEALCWLLQLKQLLMLQAQGVDPA